jgi:hypothetical protein
MDVKPLGLAVDSSMVEHPLARREERKHDCTRQCGPVQRFVVDKDGGGWEMASGEMQMQE